MDDIKEIRAYLNNKVVEAKKKRTADKLNSSATEGTGEFISVT